MWHMTGRYVTLWHVTMRYVTTRRATTGRQFPGLDELEAVAVAGYERGGVGESGVWRLDPRWDALSPPDAAVELIV